jgi:hypothetical protein
MPALPCPDTNRVYPDASPFNSLLRSRIGARVPTVTHSSDATLLHLLVDPRNDLLSPIEHLLDIIVGGRQWRLELEYVRAKPTKLHEQATLERIVSCVGTRGRGRLPR